MGINEFFGEFFLKIFSRCDHYGQLERMHFFRLARVSKEHLENVIVIPFRTLQRRSAHRVGSHYAMQVVACSGINCDKFDRDEWRGDFRGKINQDYK